MPPSAVKTVRDVIFWQYAKLVSRSANLGNSRAFQMSVFVKLRDGKMNWSSTVREWLREHDGSGECVYCSSKTALTVEHVFPRSAGGADVTDNTILVCKSCNSSKGSKRLYEWFGLNKKDEIPRIAEGKYLKFLYQMHEKAGTLDLSINDLVTDYCSKCYNSKNCVKEGSECKLSVYCPEGIL